MNPKRCSVCERVECVCAFAWLCLARWLFPEVGEGCCAKGWGCADVGFRPVALGLGVIIEKYLSCCAPEVIYVVYTTKNIKCGLEHSFRVTLFCWLVA